MLLIHSLTAALGQVFLPTNLLLTFLGVAGGVLIGALPGLTGTMAIALLVPFTYGMNPIGALVLLGGVYVGAMFGGSIAAILVNVPGTPSAIAATFDGYPLAKKGKAQYALMVSVVGSTAGGMLGALVLLFLSPLLAELALRFGPPEYFWLGVMGLTIIGTLTSKSVFQGLAGGALGVLISTIGYSPFSGVPRFTFGQPALLGGVDLIVALIGLFSIPEVLKMAEHWQSTYSLARYKRERGVLRAAAVRLARNVPGVIRSSIIGVLIGIIPGAGGNVAGLVSYNEAARAARKDDEFGHGQPEGVLAAQTATHAELSGSLVPLLTLGIPGAPQAAVLLGALLLQGLRPGPALYSGPGAKITYAFILSLFVATAMMLVVGVFASQLYANLLNLPVRYLMPVILLLSTVGAFAIRNNPADIVIMVAIGVLAYFLEKLGVHPGTIALGVILGPIVENGLLQTMQIGQATGSVWALFFTRPISIVLIFLSVMSAGWPLISRYVGRARRGRAEGEGPS